MRQRVASAIPESLLSDIRLHPPLRLPKGRLKRGKNTKAAVGGKKSPAVCRDKNEYIICTISFLSTYINRGSEIFNLMDKQ